MKKEKASDTVYEEILKMVGIDFDPFSTPSGESFCTVRYGDGSIDTYSLESKHLKMLMQQYCKDNTGSLMPQHEWSLLLEELRLIAFNNSIDHNLVNRVYQDSDTLWYDLGNGSAVKVTAGKVAITKLPEQIFVTNTTSSIQTEPNLDIDPQILPDLISKHLNLPQKGDLLLFTIYLVACFLGRSLNQYILVLQGEPASGKSTLLERLVAIVDPTEQGLSAPPTIEALTLQLSSSYLLALDNVSHMPKAMSDLLCISVTRG